MSKKKKNRNKSKQGGEQGSFNKGESIDQKGASGGSDIKKSMVDKTKIFAKKPPVSTGTIVGLGLLMLVLVVCLVGLVLVIVTRFAPRLDKNMVAPTLNEMPEYTNKKSVIVSGDATGDNDSVMLYVNGEKLGDLLDVIESSEFTYEYVFPSEGSFDFSAVAVNTGVIRTRSEGSDIVTTVYDATPPSTEIEMEYPDEVTESQFDLSGVVGSSETIVLGKEGDVYYAEADSSGEFAITGVEVVDGENEFTVSLEDRAGNVSELGGIVNVLYSSNAGVNGDGASHTSDGTSSEDLPNSAGELEAALSALGFNRIMVLVGLLALGLFMANSAIVGVKLAKRA